MIFDTVTELCHRLPTEVAKSPSLQIFKSHLVVVLGNWFCLSRVPSNLNHSVIL